MKKEKTLTYLGIFLGTLLVISAVLRLFTPQEQEIPTTDFNNTNINQTTSEFSNIIFTGQSPNFPEKLTISQVKEISNENQVISKILLTYDLKPHSTLKRYWENSSGQYLQQDIYSKKYELLIGEEAVEELPSVDLEQIINTASDKLTTLFPDLKLTPLEDQVVFTRQAVEFYEPTNLASAELISVPFSYTIDSYPLRYQKEILDPFIAMLGNQGQILRIDFSPFFISTQPISSNSRISIKQAIDNINNNQGSIISFGIEEGVKANISVIKTADLKEVVLEYRHDLKLGLAYPFYRFSGSGQDLSGQEIKLEIITPAVVTTPIN